MATSGTTGKVPENQPFHGVTMDHEEIAETQHTPTPGQSTDPTSTSGLSFTASWKGYPVTDDTTPTEISVDEGRRGARPKST